MSQQLHNLVDQFVGGVMNLLESNLKDAIDKSLKTGKPGGLEIKPASQFVVQNGNGKAHTNGAAKPPKGKTKKKAVQAKSNGKASKQHAGGPSDKIMSYLIAHPGKHESAALQKAVKVKREAFQNAIAYLGKAGKIKKGPQRGQYAAVLSN